MSGISVICRLPITCPIEDVLVSSRGAFAKTSMASEVAPTSNVKSRTRRSCTRMSIPSRTAFLKPAASTDTRYGPGIRNGTIYDPSIPV